MERTKRVSVSLSTSPKKASLFSFLGCCTPSKNDKEDRTPSKRTTIPAHPATTISMGQPNGKKSFATEYTSATGNVAKQTDCEGNSEVSIIRDLREVGRIMLIGNRYKIIAKINLVTVDKAESLQQMVTAINKEVKKSDGSFDSPNAKKKDSMKGSFMSSMKRTFSKTEDDYAHQPQITSQSIAHHIAKRLKCDIIIDALCGFGGNTIQFANYCNYVIAIESNPEKIACAKINAQKNLKTLDSIDFMAMDFLKIKKLSGDIVFLHPTDTRKSQTDQFSLFKNLEPELSELLTKSLEVSHCVAIRLPHETDTAELASIFHRCFEKNRLHKKRFCIEVERIFDSDNKPECIIVYFGDLSTIDQKEEYEALYEYMLSEESNDTRARIPLQVFAAIIEKVGLGKSFKYLSEIEDPVFQKNTKNTRFNNFTALIIEKEILTQEDLEKIIEEESKRPSSSIFSAPNSYTPTLALLKKNSSAINDPIRSAILSGQMKRKTNGNGTNIWGSNSEEESDSIPKTYTKILGSKFKRDGSTPPSSRPQDRFDTEENNEPQFKNSHEVSDLIISSYSVDSNYLDDFSPYDESDINVRKASRAKKDHSEITPRNRQTSLKVSRMMMSKDDHTRSRNFSRHQKDLTSSNFASNLLHREEQPKEDKDHESVPFYKFKDEADQSQRDEEEFEDNKIKMGNINKFI